MGRVLSLKRDAKKSKISNEEVCKTVAKELATFWIFIGNLYPKTEKNIAKKIQKDYNELKRLQSYPKKTCKKYLSDIVIFNTNMSKGYDIRSEDKAYEKRLENEFGVKVTAEEELYYQNNCFGDWTAKSMGIDPKWLKKKNRNELRKYCEDQKLLKIQKDMEIQKDLNISEIATAMIDDDIHTDTEGGATFSCSLNSRKDKLLNSSSENINPNFPQIPIRTNFKTLNEVIIRCIVQISADYNLPPSTASSILCDVGNTVFHQNWEKNYSN